MLHIFLLNVAQPACNNAYTSGMPYQTDVFVHYPNLVVLDESRLIKLRKDKTDRRGRHKKEWLEDTVK